jgi:hypothetical protein
VTVFSKNNVLPEIEDLSDILASAKTGATATAAAAAFASHSIITFFAAARDTETDVHSFTPCSGNTK